MYFLWKRTPNGTIRVSCEGMSDFVEGCLTAQERLCTLALASGERALLTLVMSSTNPSHEPLIERQISSIIEPLGMSTSVVWVSRGNRSIDWLETRFALLKNPWCWMSLASSISLIVFAGWAGFFWTAFWGAAAWFTVRGLNFLINKTKRTKGFFAHSAHSGRSR